MDSIPGVLEAKIAELEVQIAELERSKKVLLKIIRKCFLVMQHSVLYIPEAPRDPQGEIQTEVELDSKGFHTRRNHPMEMIHQPIQMGQSMHVSIKKGELACYPLLTRSHPVGALWMLIPEVRGQNFANVQLMANQAAVTLERVNLLAESRRQAREIEAAYEELEMTYDQTLKALMSALDARDRETEGHSMRVSKLACMLGEKIGLNSEQLKALERGALLHDIGKIGISDIILHKPGKLTDDEWKIMRMHPDIGAGIVERIPFLAESMSVVRYHHERRHPHRRVL